MPANGNRRKSRARAESSILGRCGWAANGWLRRVSCRTGHSGIQPPRELGVSYGDLDDLISSGTWRAHRGGLRLRAVTSRAASAVAIFVTSSTDRWSTGWSRGFGSPRLCARDTRKLPAVSIRRATAGIRLRSLRLTSAACLSRVAARFRNSRLESCATALTRGPRRARRRCNDQPALATRCNSV